MTTSLSEIHSRHVLALPSTMASQKSHGMGSRDEFGVWIKTSLNQPSSDITIIRISYLYYINSRYPNILPLYVPTYAPKLRSRRGGVFRTIRSSGGKAGWQEGVPRRRERVRYQWERGPCCCSLTRERCNPHL